MFNILPNKEQTFSSLDETLAFAAHEKRHIERIPIRDCWPCNLHFFEDAFLGNSRSHLMFNADGFRALANLIGISDTILFQLSKPNLATSLLNNLLKDASETQSKLADAELVYDSSENAIIGITTKLSGDYSNEDFLRDVLSTLDKKNIDAIFPHTNEFEFRGAHSINTRLNIKMVSKAIKTKVFSAQLNGSELNEIGLDLTNDLFLGKASRIGLLIHRPSCSSNLSLPIFGAHGKLSYNGNHTKFQKQVQKATSEALICLSKARTLVEKLADVPFSAISLAKYADTKILFGILGASECRSKINKNLRNKDYLHLSKSEAKLRQKADSILLLAEFIDMEDADQNDELISLKLSSMYDFIRLFSDYARMLPTQKRLETETQTGFFVNWLFQNKRKFML